jgi:CheY-like chemotaxis protein/anti-sigma regulatory factor (Ser/Thr protein kinase)
MSGASSTDEQGRTSTLLVVDDSATDRELAGGLLRKNSEWLVQFASDGAQALERLSEGPVGAVITDLQMPQLNGLELVQRVLKEYPLTPVVLMTSRGNEQVAVQALEDGAASYVSKHALSRDLVPTVTRVLAAAHEQQGHVKMLAQMQSCRLSFELENDFDVITALASHLQGLLRQMGVCAESEVVRVAIALEEALVNAVYHGNLEVSSELRERDHQEYYNLARKRTKESPYRERRTRVSVEFTRSSATFVIRDDGPGFDPGSLPDATDPTNLERPCGRGLLLMTTFMNEVTYNERGNEVTLVKHADSDR